MEDRYDLFLDTHLRVYLFLKIKKIKFVNTHNLKLYLHICPIKSGI